MLSLYGFVVRHVALGGEKTGFITTPIEYVSTFPKTVYNVLNSNELKGIPATYLLKDSTFEEVNNLNSDIYGINSFYNSKKNRWDIKLFNFKTDSTVYEWFLSKDNDFREDRRKFDNARPMHSVMLADRQLILSCHDSGNLYKIDDNSNIIWHNTNKIFHHSLNLDSDSNVWVCASETRKFKLQNKMIHGQYEDEFITKVDTETGKILYDKSVSDLLIENGYKNFVYGFSNSTEPNSDIDPLHLNDIQPVLKNGPFWKKDDLFISLRHKSLIVHYRPETKKIIRMIHGPFLFQHDVDIISDHEIALFNNNTTTIGNFDYEMEEARADSKKWDEILHSEILIYNYKDSTFRTLFKDSFKEENIYTRTEGLYELLPSGNIYVENHNDGELYIFNKHGEVLLKKQFATSHENLVHMPTWVRLYENVQF